MIAAPSLSGAALLVGLSLFLGFAFEDFFAHGNIRRPGGIRTFPILASAGGVLYLFDPAHFIPFTAGLAVLGIWLAVFYRQHVGERDDQGEPNVGLVVPALNVHAYLLGPIALALPPWFAVGFTVIAVLLLTGREKLHALARRVDVDEVITAGEFLILTGIVLPLLPNEPVTTLTTITPRHAWLALVVVCSLSYASYLAQRYGPPRRAGCGWRPWAGFIRRPRPPSCWRGRQGRRRHAQQRAGRYHAGHRHHVSAHPRHRGVLQFALAMATGAWLIGLSVAGLVICALQYRLARGAPRRKPTKADCGDRRQSARAWSGGAVRRPVRRGVARFQLGESRVRNVGHLHIGGHRRRHRHRSVRAQSGAGRHVRAVERRDRRRDPDRRLIQQYSQSDLCRGVRGRAHHDRQCRGAGAARGGRRDRRADDRQRISSSCHSDAGATFVRLRPRCGRQVTETSKRCVSMPTQRMPWSL